MTAAIFRRQLFRDLGGLDETFGSYMEDVDFGLRCALAGREGLYRPIRSRVSPWQRHARGVE